ncbi:efflux RND transporter periplasmic adaptor subunit [Vibrio ostreicida]|uniref:Efflux RND transporter periplasmic adaptor subunit n=1 Tax=Vibrio ostreicida TaxID=526588 RepID=A0ABT8BXM1_9VIBR|nr:efflux RND transporter periplasmic adaptor subunit [Vibrio ostreicida]MDN3611763.1 efflux RND transporter periplasmic adaptor subunit [Vibrio ostreicida]NPD09578.1 efflux RND transporter periplasmic adaptor subunit [Vibrio ostreicida]
MKGIGVAVFAAMTLALIGCKPSLEHRDKHPLLVETLELDAPVTSQFRSFNGQVMPAELTPLAFRLEGEISSIMVREGDRVKQGQVIALLDDVKARQNLTDAEAKYNLAFKQYKRGQELVTDSMISAADLDVLDASFKLEKANLSAAKLNVRYTRLKAPFTGVISSVDKQKYENTSPGETVVSLYQAQNVYVKLNVSDSVLALLKPEMTLDRYQPEVTFAGHDGRYAMTYLEHTSERQPSSQTYEFWLSMPQRETPILPGTSVQVTVDLFKAGLNRVQGFQLPMTAIDTGSDPKRFFVWKVENNSARRYPIMINQINGSGALINGSLKEGDIVVNSHLSQLREGMNMEGVPQ